MTYKISSIATPVKIAGIGLNLSGYLFGCYSVYVFAVILLMQFNYLIRFQYVYSSPVKPIGWTNPPE